MCHEIISFTGSDIHTVHVPALTGLFQHVLFSDLGGHALVHAQLLGRFSVEELLYQLNYNYCLCLLSNIPFRPGWGEVVI